MTQDHATPVPRRALTIVPAGTGGGPAPVPPVPQDGTGSRPVPGPGGTSVPVPAAAAVPMPVPERARLAAARWAGTAAEAIRELWLKPGRLIHVIIHGRAETMCEHWAYVKSRAWVPGGMTGNAEKLVAAAGILHHLLIARPVKAAMKTVKFAAEKVDQAADRPLRFYLVVLFVALLALLALF